MLLCACAQRSCASCSGDELAVLAQRSGEVQRDHADAAGAFSRARMGARFVSGDALRTLTSASARLRLHSAGAVVVQSDTTIRLWRGNRRGLRVKVQTGDASVIAAESPVAIETELGVAVLAPGSELRVRPGRDGQRYEVTVGRALLTDASGQQREILAGEGLGASEAVAEADSSQLSAARTPQPDAAAPVEPEPAAPAPTPAADLGLALGASASIYDPRPPSEIDLDLHAACPHGALLAIRGQRPQRVFGHYALHARAGAYAYRATCLTEDGQPGNATLRASLRVVRNPGTAQLPRSAPKNTIDADGRTYTVMFQNLLPVLVVRWPHAPSAPHYTLRVSSEGEGEQQLALDEPSHVFAAGSLQEGRHELRFEAERPGHPRARTTTVDLRFDNAAPTASLRSPPVAGFDPGSSVHVAGIALRGASVSVAGQRLALDAQHRFAGDVAIPPGTRAIAVRIQHPRTGTRYYVRRIKASR